MPSPNRGLPLATTPKVATTVPNSKPTILIIQKNKPVVAAPTMGVAPMGLAPAPPLQVGVAPPQLATTPVVMAKKRKRSGGGGDTDYTPPSHVAKKIR